MADNQLTVIGNMTREPELRFTTGGKAITSFGVAVNRRFQQNGEWVDAPTQFFNVTVWGEYGEHVAASCVKGSRVIVVGRLEFRKYENKDGVEVTTHDIIADEVGIILKYATATIEKVERTNGASQPAREPANAGARSGGQPANPVYGDEEPF